MKRLIRHLEEALYSNDCVAIPSLGSFIKQHLSCELDTKKGLIHPGHCELTFNSALDANDGILLSLYKHAYSMTQKRAGTLLQSDTEALQAALKESSMVRLGTLGRLTQDRTSGKIIFYPNESHPFSIATYGLSSISILPQLSKSTSTKEPAAKQREGIYYLPIPVRAIKYTAAAAACLTLALLIPAKTLDQRLPAATTTHHASFLTKLSGANKTESPSAAGPTETKTKTADQAIRDEAAPMPHISDVPVTSPAGPDSFYVVVGSFTSETSVEKYLHTLAPSIKESLHILRTPTMYRIYSGLFTSREAAQEHLNELSRSDTPFEGIWIYESKK